VLTCPQFRVYRLCTERINDFSLLGAHTDLLDPETGQFSTLVESQGWTSLMPQTCRSGERAATLSDEMVSLTGLSPRTAVHVGIHDSNASLVPHLLTRERPFTVVSTGTWVMVMVVQGIPLVLDEQRDALINVDAFG